MPSSNRSIFAVDQLQNSLRTILTSYVNGLYQRRSAKYGYPYAWAVAPYAVRAAINELSRAGLLLRKDPRAARWLERLYEGEAYIASKPESVLLKSLAEGYRYLEQVLMERNDGICSALPDAKPFDSQTYLELDKDYFRPVIALEKYTRDELLPFLADAWIQGSVGDLGLARGYSDLDVLYVLKEEVVTNPERLSSFARKCYRAHTYLYSFDYLQHHGFQVSTTIDWLAYPQSWLPLESLDQGIALIRQTERVRVRDSQFDAREAFSMVVESFILRARSDWLPSSAYEFKYFLSILMLLPTLFLQAQGVFSTKRESFGKLSSLDVELDDSILRTASDIRLSWPENRVPYKLRLLHPKVPTMLFDSRTKYVVDQFSDTFVQDAASFAVRLHELVWNGKDRQISLSGSALTITSDPTPYSLTDYASARECYVERAASENGVAAIFEFGTVTEPGLSDLDFVVLVNDNASVNVDCLSIHSLSLPHANLIMHEPIVIPLSLAPNLNEWLPFAELHLLYGRDGQSNIPMDIDRSADLSLRAASLLERLYRHQSWFLKARQSSQFDARWGLAIMKSLQYSIRSVEEIAGTAIESAADFAEDTKALRRDWFSIEDCLLRNERLRSLHVQGTKLTQEILTTSEKWLHSEAWLYSESSANDNALGRLVNLYAREEPNAAYLNAAPGPAPQTPFEDYLSQRAAILAKQQRFLRANNMCFGYLF